MPVDFKRGKRTRAVRWQVAAALLGLLLAPCAQAQQAPHETASLEHVVRADGTIHLPASLRCGRWKVTLDPRGRARFVRTDGGAASCATAHAAGFWDDQLVLPEAAGFVRTVASEGGATYVDSRFVFGATSVGGVLKWETATGRWQVVGRAPAPPAPRAHR